jgi:hypothetical protein
VRWPSFAAGARRGDEVKAVVKGRCDVELRLLSCRRCLRADVQTNSSPAGMVSVVSVVSSLSSLSRRRVVMG